MWEISKQIRSTDQISNEIIFKRHLILEPVLYLNFKRGKVLRSKSVLDLLCSFILLSRSAQWSVAILVFYKFVGAEDACQYFCWLLVG